MSDEKQSAWEEILLVVVMLLVSNPIGWAILLVFGWGVVGLVFKFAKWAWS